MINKRVQEVCIDVYRASLPGHGDGETCPTCAILVARELEVQNHARFDLVQEMMKRACTRCFTAEDHDEDLCDAPDWLRRYEYMMKLELGMVMRR